MVWEKTLVLLIILFSSLLVGAVPPGTTQTNVNTDLGIQIFYPDYGVIPINNPFTLQIHVTNITDGKALSSSLVNCTLEIYNQTGAEILNVNLTKIPGGSDHETTIPSTTFSSQGVYAYRIYCSNVVGGTVYGILEATYNGTILDTAEAILISFFLTINLLLIIGVSVLLFKLPHNDVKDDSDEIISVNHMKYLSYTLYIIQYVLIFALLYLSSNISYAYLNSVLFGKFFFTLYVIMGRVAIPALVVWMVFILLRLVRDKKLDNYIEMGIVGGERPVR